MDTEQQPPAKKPKDDDKSEMKVNNCKPRPILTDEITRQPILEKAFAGVLKNKKYISKAIAGLANCLPNPPYLKRCSGLRIYLASIDKVNGDPENLKKLLVQEGFDMSLLEDEYEIVEVPVAPPRTKSQVSYITKYWPVNFHPDLNLEALISDSYFDDEQLASLEICMRLAISASENTAVGTKECNGSALIVDPIEGSILSIAASSTDQHPMYHASMLAVDLVARVQGGGAWKLIGDIKNQVNSAKRIHSDSTSLCYPDSLARLDMPKNGSLICVRDEEKKSKSTKKNMDSKIGPYLCTGYWAILLQEPCPLCAMALLHSRVSRIFYGAANSRIGILGSNATLHSIPGLNHRYQVWGSVLEDECIRTLKTCREDC